MPLKLLTEEMCLAAARDAGAEALNVMPMTAVDAVRDRRWARQGGDHDHD